MIQAAWLLAAYSQDAFDNQIGLSKYLNQTSSLALKKSIAIWQLV
jgi:hypothetical protein